MKRLVNFILIAAIFAALMPFASAFSISGNVSTNVVCPSSTIVLQQIVLSDKAGPFTITSSGSAKDFSTTVPSGFFLGAGDQQTIYTYITPSSRIMPGKYYIITTVESNGESKETEKEIVVENCRNSVITAEASAKICSCEEKTIMLNIENKGRYLENYKLSVEGPAAKWVTLSANSIALSPNSNIAVEAYIKTPCDVKGDYEMTFVLEASQYSKSTAKSKIEITSCYDYVLSAEKTLYKSCEGDSLSIPINIKNLGTAQNTYKINLNAPSWIKQDQKDLSIGQNGEKAVNLLSNPPFGTTGNFTISMDVLSDFGKVMKKISIEQDVEKCYDVSVSIESEKDRMCNALSSSYSVAVKNTGRFTNTYDLSVIGPEWATLSNKSVTLAAGSQVDVNLALKPSFEVKPGAYSIIVKAIDGTSKTEANDTIKIETISTSDCYKPAISSQKDTISISRDTTATLPLIVENKGTNDAKYTIEIGGTASGFCQINPGAITVKHGEAQTIYLYVAPSIEAKPANYTLSVTARLADSTILASKNIIILVDEKEIPAPAPVPAVSNITSNVTTNVTKTNVTANVTANINVTANLTNANATIANVTANTTKINTTSILPNMTASVTKLNVTNISSITSGNITKTSQPSLWQRFVAWLAKVFKPKSTGAAVANATNITIINGTNHAPVLVNNISDIEMKAGKSFSLDLANYFRDDDKDALTYISIKPLNMSIDNSGSKITITPENNFTGSVNTTFYAYDGKNMTASNVVKIIVK